MTMRDLTPWREKSSWPTLNRDPFLAMQRDLDTMLQDVWGNSPTHNLERVFPRVNVSENPEAYRVTAELPGMEEKDVQVSFEGNLLLVSGKKTDEKEEKGREWYRRERVSGEFQRAIELPPSVDTSKATATFSKGVLTVDVAKRGEAKMAKRTIEVKPA